MSLASVSPPVLATELPPPLWWPIVQPGSRLTNLNHHQCLRLLSGATTGIAGVAFTGPRGPAATMADYQILGSAVVLGRLGAEVEQAMVARQLLLVRFDHFDAEHSIGWTVVLVSRREPAHHVELELWPLAGRHVEGAGADRSQHVPADPREASHVRGRLDVA